MASEMVSLRDTMNRMDRQDALLKRAQSCYVAALTGVENHVLRQCAAKLGESPLTLEPERRRLAKGLDEEGLTRASGGLEASLRAASAHIERQLAGRVELAEVLKLLEQTTASLVHRGDAREGRFIGVKQGLESAAALEDVAEFRRRIQEQVGELGRLVDEMRRENRQLAEELDHEMSHYRRKLDAAEELAHRDSLTGLPNRRLLERKVQVLIDGGTPFCLVMMDLERFKAINDQHGHLAGDELLRAFALRLKNRMKDDDISARWGGDEFVMLLPCSLRDGMRRAQALEQGLAGEYTLETEPRPIRVNLGISMGVAEHRSGETADQLLARADSMLYVRRERRPA